MQKVLALILTLFSATSLADVVDSDQLRLLPVGTVLTFSFAAAPENIKPLQSSLYFVEGQVTRIGTHTSGQPMCQIDFVSSTKDRVLNSDWEFTLDQLPSYSSSGLLYYNTISLKRSSSFYIELSCGKYSGREWITIGEMKQALGNYIDVKLPVPEVIQP